MSADELFRELAALLADDPSRVRRHAIAVLDVDGLTAINRERGARAGDAVLAAVADALARELRPGERAAWWAGDQYVALFPGIGRRQAIRRTRRILARLPVALSAGVAAYPRDGESNAALVDVAGAALVCAKSGRRPTLCR